MTYDTLTNGASTTLNGTIGSGDATMVPSVYGAFPPIGQTRVLIDTELILITDLSARPWTIQRGIEGTAPAGHANLATITQVFTAGGMVNALPNILSGIDTVTPISKVHTDTEDAAFISQNNTGPYRALRLVSSGSNVGALGITLIGTGGAIDIDGTSSPGLDQSGLINITSTISPMLASRYATLKLAPTVTLPSGNIMEYYNIESRGSVMMTRTSQVFAYGRFGMGGVVTINGSGVTPNVVASVVLDFPTVSLINGGVNPSTWATLLILSAPPGGNSIQDNSGGVWRTGSGGLVVTGGSMTVNAIAALNAGVTVNGGARVNNGLDVYGGFNVVTGLATFYQGASVLTTLSVTGRVQANNVGVSSKPLTHLVPSAGPFPQTTMTVTSTMTMFTINGLPASAVEATVSITPIGDYSGWYISVQSSTAPVLNECGRIHAARSEMPQFSVPIDPNFPSQIALGAIGGGFSGAFTLVLIDYTEPS